MKPELIEHELTSEGPVRLRKGRTRHRSVTVNVAESPIGWLHARGHLDRRQFEAGERLRADYERACIGPTITMRWEPVRLAAKSGPGLHPTEAQIAARARFDAAMAVAGSGLKDILWRVVCACETLQNAERALAWPARSGKLILRFALERVADFYRIG